MKKRIILTVSDSHGAEETLRDILLENDAADTVVFLGDGERDLETALAETGIDPYDPCARKTVIRVRGNCDFFSSEPVTVLEKFGDFLTLITHGHDQNVKYGLHKLAFEAKSRGCALALFGHTHQAHLSEIEGVRLFNPGSVRSGRYGIVTIDGSDIRFEHKKMER